MKKIVSGLFTLLLGSGILGLTASAQTGARAVDAEGHQWWQHAVFYEIYPRSFADSNNDGVGDLKGIASKLDYLKDLGVDAIWISPCFPSPQVDFGYDVSDYENIDPMYGTLADFDLLASEAKKRDIHIILDFVVNHSSDQHKWFLDSKSSRTSAHRDWYIWRDGKGPGQPPNNWVSTFGGSAWKFDPATNQYYYHFFYAEQPDLNWRNPAVKDAMFDVTRWWYKRGVPDSGWMRWIRCLKIPSCRTIPLSVPERTRSEIHSKTTRTIPSYRKYTTCCADYERSRMKIMLY